MLNIKIKFLVALIVVNNNIISGKKKEFTKGTPLIYTAPPSKEWVNFLAKMPTGQSFAFLNFKNDNVSVNWDAVQMYENLKKRQHMYCHESAADELYAQCQKDCDLMINAVTDEKIHEALRYHTNKSFEQYLAAIISNEKRTIFQEQIDEIIDIDYYFNQSDMKLLQIIMRLFSWIIRLMPLSKFKAIYKESPLGTLSGLFQKNKERKNLMFDTAFEAKPEYLEKAQTLISAAMHTHTQTIADWINNINKTINPKRLASNTADTPKLARLFADVLVEHGLDNFSKHQMEQSDSYQRLLPELSKFPKDGANYDIILHIKEIFLEALLAKTILNIQLSFTKQTQIGETMDNSSPALSLLQKIRQKSTIEPSILDILSSVQTHDICIKVLHYVTNSLPIEELLKYYT